MESPLKIAVQTDWKREAAECSLGGFERRKDCKLPGYAAEILDLIMKYAQIPYTIVSVPKGVGAGRLIDRESKSVLFHSSSIKQAILSEKLLELTEL